MYLHSAPIRRIVHVAKWFKVLVSFYMIINGVVFVCSITVYKHAGGCGCLVDDLILLCK